MLVLLPTCFYMWMRQTTDMDPPFYGDTLSVFDEMWLREKHRKRMIKLNRFVPLSMSIIICFKSAEATESLKESFFETVGYDNKY